MNAKTNTKDIHSTLNPSPFHIDDNMFIICENRNKNCTQKEIDSLISKEILNHIDLEIMRLLCRYGFVNSYNIGFALSYTLLPQYRKKSYQRNLQKMVRAGILLKYSIRTGDSLEDAYISPMHFYALSAGAQDYIAPHVDTPFPRKLVLSKYDIMDCLTASQLLIHFLKDYGNNCSVSARCLKRGKNRLGIIFDGMIQFNGHENCFNHPTQIVLFSVRDNIESFTRLYDRILNLEKILKEKYPKYDSFLVIIVESIASIRSISDFMVNDETLDSRLHHYYTVDTLLHTDPLLQSLFNVTFDTKKNISILNRVELHLQ